MAGQSPPSLACALLRALATLRRGASGALPESGLEAAYDTGGIDMARVVRYRDAVDGPNAHLPLTYFYLHAQRAQVALMLDGRFPFAIPGLIHVANDMRFHRMPRLGASLEARVVVRSVLASERGGRIVFDVELTQFGEKVVTCTSAYQIRRAGGNKPPAAEGGLQPPPVPALSEWEFTVAAARRYASASGDFNPIHLSSLLAKAFGYRSAIAHGMYSVGRSATAIERHGGRPLVAIGARFTRPIHLPGRVRLDLEGGGECGTYAVSSPDRQSRYVGGTWSLSGI